MKSIKELYRIGTGPSSSHTMGPRKAAEMFLERHPDAASFKVTLYGSLAATGKGHMTDVAIIDTLQPTAPVEIVWQPKVFLPFHPNGMTFAALDNNDKVQENWTVYSIGGGALAENNDNPTIESPDVYGMENMTEILQWCEDTGKSYWEYVKECEEEDIWDYLAEVWATMKDAIHRGLEAEGVLPGPLNLRRKASTYYIRATGYKQSLQSRGLVFSYALAVSEENASGGKIVTAPTCGSCGVMPAVLYHLQKSRDFSDMRILRARDTKFLKEIGYDLIKSSAQFAVDHLWHKPDGTYTAAPSTSPEHGPVDEGVTFAHAVVREILLDAIQASKVLGTDAKERKQWENVLTKLVPYRIGRYGQLLEWSTDIDDPKDEHRHVNHLFGLHPGHTISPVTTPELAQAAKVVLEHRGDGATGWSMGWKLNQWARLQDGNHAYKLYGNLLKNGTLDNLWDTHAPFQIDGNFGGTAGITEMLLQSHMGFIQLLPALPDAWANGSISGICAKGNFEVSISWKEGQLEKAIIHSKSGIPCNVRYGDKTLKFKTVKGKKYEITLKGDKLAVL